MKPGDVLFFHGTILISQIIEWITNSKWSHVAIVVSPDEYIEATWPRVKRSKLSDLKNESYVVMTWIKPLTESELTYLVGNMTAKIGTPYSLKGLISFLTRRRFGNKSYYFCSDFVQEQFLLIGRCLIRRVPWWTRPQDLYQSMEITESA